jgi:hypothetical protein
LITEQRIPSVTGKPTNPFAVSKIQPDSPSGILCMGLFFQNLICFSIFLLFFKVLIDCSWSAGIARIRGIIKHG